MLGHPSDQWIPNNCISAINVAGLNDAQIAAISNPGTVAKLATLCDAQFKHASDSPLQLGVRRALEGAREIAEPIVRPRTPTATVAAGGTLGANTYFYVVCAEDEDGNLTEKSAEFSGTTAGGNLTLNLAWLASPKAVAYRVYRATATGVLTGVYATGFKRVTTNALADNGSVVYDNSDTVPPTIGKAGYGYLRDADVEAARAAGANNLATLLAPVVAYASVAADYNGGLLFS